MRQEMRVFQNRIDNSLRYRGEGTPEIRISAERAGEEWVLSFRDNGLGFAREKAEEVFGLFKRLHAKSHQ